MGYKTVVTEGKHGLFYEGDLDPKYILASMLHQLEQLAIGEQLRIQTMMNRFDPTTDSNGRVWTCTAPKEGTTKDIKIDDWQYAGALLHYLVAIVERDDE